MPGNFFYFPLRSTLDPVCSLCARRPTEIAAADFGKADKQSLPLTLGDAALVLPQLLYPVPLFLRNNGLLCTGQLSELYWRI